MGGENTRRINGDVDRDRADGVGRSGGSCRWRAAWGGDRGAPPIVPSGEINERDESGRGSTAFIFSCRAESDAGNDRPRILSSSAKSESNAGNREKKSARGSRFFRGPASTSVAELSNRTTTLSAAPNSSTVSRGLLPHSRNDPMLLRAENRTFRTISFF